MKVFPLVHALAFHLCLRWVCLLLLGGSAMSTAWAHKASDAYLVLSDAGSETQARLSMALQDLDAAIDTLDADDDRQLTWGEIRSGLPSLVRWVGEGMVFRCGQGALVPVWRFESLEQRSDGVYLRLWAPLSCGPGESLTLRYRLLGAVDPTHRLLLTGSLQGQALAAVLPPQAPEHTLRSGAAGGVAQSGVATLANFFVEGVHHLLTGYDHLAFLLSLLLPIMLRQTSASRLPAQGLGALLLTVTGFTVGHSITLALASLGAVTASPVWVEPAIAATIAVSAALNLRPWPGLRTEVLALVFGLIHGLAFSGVITEAGVTGALRVWALAGFNLGVETGQLVGVGLWCLVHLALVRWHRYEQVVVRGGSLLLLLVALYWMVDRLIA